MAYLRAHIVRGPLHSNGMVVRILKNFRYTEVSKFYSVIPRKEDILRFNVSVKYFPSMDIFKGEAKLDKPIHNLSFSVKFILCTSLFNVEGQISYLTELHDDN